MPDKGGAPAPITQEAKVKQGPEQEALFKLALPFAQQYAAQQPEVYSGQTRAGLSPKEQEAEAMYLAQVPRVQNMATQGANAQQFLLDPNQLRPESNPYISGVADEVNRKITSQLTQNILPNIRGGEQAAGGTYGGGSSRSQMAERLASTDSVRAMETGMNDLYFKNYMSGINNMQQGVQMNPSAMSQQLFGADVTGAVGAQQRTETQGQLDDAFTRWNLQQQLPYLRASELTGLASGFPGAGTTTTVTGSQPPGVNPWMGMLGGSLSGAALGSSFGPWGMALGGLGGAGVGYLGSNRRF